MDERWIFCPQSSAQHRDVAEDELIAYNPELQLSYLQTTNPDKTKLELGTGTVVVRINGLCEGDGKKAQGSWGVYFGPGSRYNAKATTQADQSIAEIDALWKAVNTIDRICAENTSLRSFVIVTDSNYILLAMSFWAPNGGKSAKGRPVPFAERFIPIYDNLYFTNFVDCRDIKITFWQVSPDKNDEAYQLSLRALNR
ncbi:ribonuclease H-like protein [Xylaria longipes]|nr:ribonuclease H-like protein [Xylaria longipes]